MVGSRIALVLGVVLVVAASCASDSGESTGDQDEVLSTSDDDTAEPTPAATPEPTETPPPTAEPAPVEPEATEAPPPTNEATPESTEPADSDEPTPPTDSTGGDEQEAAIGSGEIDPGLKPFVDDAVGQLAETLAISKAQITVQSARLAQWGDSSLGCPEKGMEYLQVVMDGSAIELVVDGKSYWFHSGGSRTPFPCTSALRVKA